MPRSRESEGPQRQSPRGQLHLRSTSSSDSNSTHHHRPITDKSPKLGGGRRSPRGSHSDPALGQKKLGTRIADLESQLGQAQVELKNLKGQLASAELAKKEAQEKLEKKITKKPKARTQTKVQDKRSSKDVKIPEEIINESQRETDVFEVPMEEPKVDQFEMKDQESEESEVTELLEPKKPSFDELAALKDDELSSLKVELEEKDKEIESSLRENDALKHKLSESELKITEFEAKNEEMNSKLAEMGSELKESKTNEAELKKKLEEVESAKEGIEIEMKKMKIQTEQWRKAADAAAAVLAGDVEMNNGRRISERCGSMDKHIGHLFDPSSIGGYNNGFVVGSPGFSDDFDDGGKRKSSGIRMFGDLWKKKAQK